MNEFKADQKVKRTTKESLDGKVHVGDEVVIREVLPNGELTLWGHDSWARFNPEYFVSAPGIADVKEGDEVTVTITVQDTVWRSVDGRPMVGDNNGYEVTEENLLAHVPAAPKYKKGERFFAKQGYNDVLAVYSPSEKEPELPWLVVFSDGSYGPQDGRLLSDLRPIPEVTE